MKFTKEDILYADGFPANVNLNATIVVQVTKPKMQSVILYYCKITNNLTRSFLPLNIGEVYDEGIYSF